MLASALLLLAFTGPAAAFDLQGHRGARGLAPENTLPGFAVALGIGVTTLELDLVVTADDRLVVVHDLELDPAITRGPDGRWLRGTGPAVRSLTLAELRGYDVGRINPLTRYSWQFPRQRPADGARIPMLAEVVALTAAAGDEEVRFNIETKLDPGRPELTPEPDAFARLVVEEVRRLGIEARTTVQSFDWRTLRAVQALAPDVPTVCLTVEQRWADNLERGRPGASPWLAGLDRDDFPSVPELVAAAGCRVWSPWFEELHALALHEAHALGLGVVPWTVNDLAAMEALVKGGADGIITDYPDRLRELLVELDRPVPPPTPLAP